LPDSPINQVTEQSLIKYGIKANALLENNLTIFLQAAEYTNAEALAVTTIVEYLIQIHFFNNAYHS